MSILLVHAFHLAPGLAALAAIVWLGVDSRRRRAAALPIGGRPGGGGGIPAATEGRTRTAGETLAAVVAVLSAGAASIHLTVAPDHFREFWLFGLFFLVAAFLQVAWGALVWRRPSRQLVAAGAAGNAAVVVLWAVTRISGLPLGPDPGVPEAVGFVDLVATTFEVLLVVGCLLWLTPAVRRLRLRPDSYWIAVAMVAAGVLVLTVQGALTGGG